LNKFIGNKLARRIIPHIRSGSEQVTGYPAFYSLGNAYSLERFLNSKKGLKVEYKYHYGAVDYFSFFFPFALLITLFNIFSSRLGIKLFASNVLVKITKEY
jgi:hypothetical protein